MARHGENIYQRKDGRYEGRYVLGKKPNGQTRFGYVYGRKYVEVQRLLLQKKAEHMKALDIKQSAEQNIIFYQKQIADKIKGLPPVFLDQAIRDTMNKIADNFHDYSMALYLFSFSLYLEVMILTDFGSEICPELKAP